MAEDARGGGGGRVHGVDASDSDCGAGCDDLSDVLCHLILVVDVSLFIINLMKSLLLYTKLFDLRTAKNIII